MNEQGLLERYAIWQVIFKDKAKLSQDVTDKYLIRNECDSCSEGGCSGCGQPGCGNCSA